MRTFTCILLDAGTLLTATAASLAGQQLYECITI